MSEQVVEAAAEASWYHLCNHGGYLQICKLSFSVLEWKMAKAARGGLKTGF